MDVENLIHEYGDRLLRSAWVLCRNEHDAKDLTQETFCRALDALGRFRGESGDYTWLYGILRNVYRNHRRRSVRWLPALFLKDRPAPATDPLSPLEDEVKYRQLKSALAKLSLKHREILLLRYVEGLKIEVIAQLIDLPPGTVKSRLHHAARRLRKVFPREGCRAFRCQEGENHALS